MRYSQITHHRVRCDLNHRLADALTHKVDLPQRSVSINGCANTPIDDPLTDHLAKIYYPYIEFIGITKISSHITEDYEKYQLKSLKKIISLIKKEIKTQIDNVNKILIHRIASKINKIDSKYLEYIKNTISIQYVDLNTDNIIIDYNDSHPEPFDYHGSGSGSSWFKSDC